MNKNSNVTLTFYQLGDFLAELDRRNFGAVRCEALMNDHGGGQIGPMRRRMITLTAYDSDTGEVLACTIVTGECWATMDDHQPWHRENLDQAKEIVVNHLAYRGLTVLPGVYHHEQNGRASCNLWTFDRETKRLVAREEG